MTKSRPEAIQDHPPSDKAVYLTLEYNDEPLSRRDLVRETMLSRATIQYALERLVDDELVTMRPDPTDARRHLYCRTKS